MPWKETDDPYAIWLSEIILQQTRVAQGIKYYHKILERFPKVQDLANASEDEVLSSWKGLGYYSRARNLHTAAKTIVRDFGGVFPNTYDDILALKGVGPYTAAAISSFAFGLPYAVVDGNVYRVLSRYFGISDPIDERVGRLRLQQLAQECLVTGAPGDYNQAIMDFGAMVCTPALPQCVACPMSLHCRAYHEDRVSNLPVKAKKIAVRERHFLYFVIIRDQHILLSKRGRGDIWQGLYEPPLIEAKEQLSNIELAQKASLLLGKDISHRLLTPVERTKQKLTHQLIRATFYHFDLEVEHRDFQWFALTDLDQLAMPRIVDRHFKKMFSSGLQASLF